MTADSITVSGPNYTWQWSEKDDRFRILDQRGGVIASGMMKPAVVVQPAGQHGTPRCTAGKLAGHEVKENKATWTYTGVNGSSQLRVTWRFDEHGPWLHPVVYEASAAEDVVSVNYFAEAAGDGVKSALEANGLVLPGICESEAVSPITSDFIAWNTRSWLGRGAIGGASLLQQWGSPAHYFCGFRRSGPSESEAPEDLVRAFCCGLAELPKGDFFLEQQRGRASLCFDYRGDLWGHLRGPGQFSLGAKLFFAFGPNYYEAIRGYYRGLLNAGIVRSKKNSDRKNATAFTPQWCTWGQQVATGKEGSRLDEASLATMYEELKKSGMQAGMFSIDDKWEGKYGNLTHSAERFPHFEQFLDRVRGDEHRIGLWAAFMRCEDPADLGLSPEQMLRQPDGKPYVVGGGSSKYFILDFTRPEVERVQSDLARKFVPRYKPDLVKFDFGYELPALDAAAPQDMNWAGERLLWKGLDVVVKAMREENPDIVVMSYELSPLFTDYFDLLLLCTTNGKVGEDEGAWVWVVT